MASRIGVSKQPGARLFEWRDERAKRSRFARAKGVRVRITYAYNDPLSEASVLHPPLSSPLHPPRARQIRMPSSFFYFFFIRFSLVYNKRDPSFHHRPHGNAPRRGACDEFSRVTELGGDSRGNFRIFEGMTGRKGCKIRGD